MYPRFCRNEIRKGEFCGKDVQDPWIREKALGVLIGGLKMGLKTRQGMVETSFPHLIVFPLASSEPIVSKAEQWSKTPQVWSLASQLGPFIPCLLLSIPSMSLYAVSIFSQSTS